MRTFKVIALSCNSKRGILDSGNTVTEDFFEEGEADRKVSEGFLEEILENKPAPPKEEKVKKKKGIVEKLLSSV